MGISPSQIVFLHKTPLFVGKEYDLWEGRGFGSLQGKGDENEVNEGFHLIHTLKNNTAKV